MKKHTDSALAQLMKRHSDRTFRRKSTRDLFGKHQQQTLRIDLFSRYRAAPAHTDFPATLDDSQMLNSQFAAWVAKWLRIANRAYADRPPHQGIWYAANHINQHGRGYHAKDANVQSISFFSNPTFWNVGITSRFHEEDGHHTPSELLDAFFQGPTMGECASVLQACLYRAIEELIGTAAFNQHFHKALTPFMITGNLFAGMHAKETWGSQAQHKDPADLCNPLYFLFDNKTLLKQATGDRSFSEDDVNVGDIIYLKGVETYQHKHLIDSAPGWNLLCVGKNSDDNLLYVGFAPGNFSQPKTYAEMKKMLIDGYNRTQSRDTLQLIQRQPDTDSTKRAAALADHTVSDDHPIGGVTIAISLSPAMFQYFITQRATCMPTPWHIADEPAAHEASSQTAKTVRTVTPFSAENADKLFSNYREDNADQRQLALTARKFAKAVTMRSDTKPIGLVMTGLPSIGKTHLSVAIAKLAASMGADVLFLDSQSVGNAYQHYADQHGFKAMTEDQMKAMCRDWIADADLIVFDDINSEFGCGDTFLQVAMDYCLSQNKALVLSSNEPINLTKHLSHYIGYDADYADNFLVLRNLQGKSYRARWWQDLIDSSDIGKLDTSNKIQLLANHTAPMPAAIAIECSSMRLAAIKDRFQRASGMKPADIKIVGAPYHATGPRAGKISADFYHNDADKYQAFIILVNDDSQCRQLLNLVTKVHDMGKSMVVVTADLTHCKQLIQSRIRYEPTTEKRMRDRIAHLFAQDMLAAGEEKHALAYAQAASAKISAPNDTVPFIPVRQRVHTSSADALVLFDKPVAPAPYTFLCHLTLDYSSHLPAELLLIAAAAHTQLVLFRCPAQAVRPATEPRTSKASHTQIALFRRPAPKQRTEEDELQTMIDTLGID